MTSSTERVRKLDQRLADEGGRKLNTVRLDAEAARVLARLEQGGENANQIINRLLIEYGAQHP